MGVPQSGLGSPTGCLSGPKRPCEPQQEEGTDHEGEARKEVLVLILSLSPGLKRRRPLTQAAPSLVSSARPTSARSWALQLLPT